MENEILWLSFCFRGPTGCFLRVDFSPALYPSHPWMISFSLHVSLQFFSFFLISSDLHKCHVH